MGGVRTIVNRVLVTIVIVGMLLVAGLYLFQIPRASSGSGERNMPSFSELTKKGGKKKGKVTICHRTGSKKNPYVRIRVSKKAVRAHRRHPPKHGRRDIIPAPRHGCPGSYGKKS